MSQPPPNLPESMLAVLNALWDQGPMTMRELADDLYPTSGKSAISTVQKLLERLEDKEYVQRKREGRLQIFRAVVSREQIIDEQLRSTAERFCGGSITPLFSRLIQAKNLSRDECDELRALIDELDQQNQKKKRQ